MKLFYLFYVINHLPHNTYWYKTISVATNYHLPMLMPSALKLVIYITMRPESLKDSLGINK